MEDLGDFQADDELAVEPLRELGIEVLWLPWREAASSPEALDGAIIRSTWDYHHHLAEFLAAIEALAATTKIANPLELIRWNANKRYLLDLERAGVPIVATVFSTGVPDQRALEQIAGAFGTDELVLKPTVGAGGDRTFRCTWDHAEEARNELGQVEIMIQPFLKRILLQGELSVIYFRDELQFLMRKTPEEGEFRVQEEHGGTLVRMDAIPPRVAELSRRALAMLPSQPLYARIDFAPDQNGDPLLIELELIEPSLYLRLDPQAPGRFAQAIRSWLG
jgi:glutathione synthase/RimK-type ligase-like ATP-grasp enzyme